VVVLILRDWEADIIIEKSFVGEMELANDQDVIHQPVLQMKDISHTIQYPLKLAVHLITDMLVENT
jgi:hypothetical protein